MTSPGGLGWANQYPNTLALVTSCRYGKGKSKDTITVTTANGVMGDGRNFEMLDPQAGTVVKIG